MKYRPVITLLAAAFLLPLIIGGSGCVGPKTAGTAAAGDGVPAPAVSVPILPGPDNGMWVMFYDSKTGLRGFEDETGAVRIEPRFSEVGSTEFYHIVAVIEPHGGEWDHYYLTKSGRIVGRDSLYIVGLMLPGEDYRGFIRFRDDETKLVGMFDRFGNVAIPAEYNALKTAGDGFVTALKGAAWEPQYIDLGDYDFVGGKHLLIDTLNNVLIEDFPDYDNMKSAIELSTIEKTETPHPDTVSRVSFPAANGGFYSFVNHEKKFGHWLVNDLLAGELTPEKLTEAAHDSISCFAEPKDGRRCEFYSWKSGRRELIGKAFDILKNDLIALSDPTREHTISFLMLSRRVGPEGSWKYDDDAFRASFVDLPTFTIRLFLNTANGPSSSRYNEYEFSWMDGGYKLCGVQIRDNDLFILARPGGREGE
ncbi:MAG: hypothetical protein FWB85_06005 [Chitinispirillia bacterium]|nr:hypothetical protein [Chitinispirillia bacterium]MCL2241770.1 hypothetical protein [Chitinispirillia bacterium]